MLSFLEMRYKINGGSLYIETNMYISPSQIICLEGVREGLFEVQYFSIKGRIGLIKVNDSTNNKCLTFEVFEENNMEVAA